MRPKRPKPADVAHNLIMGDSAVQACVKAGYSETTARSNAHAIVKRDAVKLELLRQAKDIQPGELGGMAKALLQQELLQPPDSSRDKVSVIRLGLEADNMIGPKEQLHLHQHSLPPIVEKMLEAKMRELLLVRKEPIETIDAEVIDAAGNRIPKST